MKAGIGFNFGRYIVAMCSFVLAVGLYCNIASAGSVAEFSPAGAVSKHQVGNSPIANRVHGSGSMVLLSAGVFGIAIYGKRRNNDRDR